MERALRLARRAEKRFPGDPDVLLLLGDVLGEVGELGPARDAYQAALRASPDDADVAASLAWAQFQLTLFDEARVTATRSNEIHANAVATALLGRLAERDGRLEDADRFARRAHALDPESYPLPCRVPESELRAIVAEALDRLPEEFRAALDGEVAILVEPVPPVETLRSIDPPWDPEILGLYVGVPLPERQATALGAKLPDIVYLFHHNLEHAAEDRHDLRDQIAVTVYHEIGHYLGYDDDELEERGFG
jgi:predicted Zn-dependent protease with MMP-like domain